MNIVLKGTEGLKANQLTFVFNQRIKSYVDLWVKVLGTSWLLRGQ